MPRFFLSAVLAIALLFVGSLAVIWWSTGADGPDGSRSVRPPEDAAPIETADAGGTLAPVPYARPTPAPGSLAGGPGADLSHVLPASAPQRGEAAPRGVTPPLSVQGSTPAARRRALASFRREFQAGLRSLDGKLAGCAAGGVALSTTAAPPSLAETSFTLTVETAGAGVRIADVQVNERGEASEAEVACAVSALRGQVIPSSSAVPGSRWETSYTPGQ